MRKDCLVTGASGGIGKAVARRLAEEGFGLFLHYHSNRQEIDQLIMELPEGCVKGVFMADFSTDENIRHFLEEMHPDVHAVVFAHGRGLTGLFQDTTDKAMNELLTSHVKAPWMISRYLIPAMVRNKAGRIVIISSIWGEEGASCEVIYSSVKGAQNSFVKALGKELAPSGITVNGVMPGLVATAMNAHLSKEELEDLYAEIPANRPAAAEEIAEVTCFLASNSPGYLQGELIKVTGGW